MAVMTKKTLVQSFSRLLKQKPFKKITVQDIAEDCGVSRMTFYYHFKDIYHLLQWILENALEKLFSDIENVAELDWREGCLRIFRFALQHKEYAKKLLPEMDQSELCLYLYRISCRFTSHMVTITQGEREILETDKKFLVENGAFCLIGTLLKWTYDGMLEEPEYIVARLGTLLESSTELAITRMQVL